MKRRRQSSPGQSTDARTRPKTKRSRLEKMAALGASNEAEYLVARCRRELARLREKLNPRMIIANLRAKRYDHVLSIGMNCEPAFRFCLSWGFVDSTPFSWASCTDTLRLAEVIRHPEQIGSEGFSFLDEILMWQCTRTGINFHGKLIPDPAMPKNAEAIANDRKDLENRLAYLNDKFTRILSDASSKAIIFRISTAAAAEEDANEEIDALQTALEQRGARNYTLVVVTERSVGGAIRSAPNRVTRTVKAFNPKNAVVQPNLGDPVGWCAIYREFAPKKILAKRRPFKFEIH